MSTKDLLTKPWFLTRELASELWVRTALISALAVLAAAVAPLLAPLVPDEMSDRLRPESVALILQILASSMLAVTTFSLSVMVTARQWASDQSTPRAHRLVQSDTTTQTVLATFLGAFVFSLVALILIEMRVVAGRSVVVLTGFTLLVVAFVVIAILRWIERLSDMGGVDSTAAQVEDEARAAIARRIAQPCLGGRPLDPDRMPDGLKEIRAQETGYVQHLDVSILETAAEKGDGRIWMAVLPGDFVAAGDVLARVSDGVEPETCEGALLIGPIRSFTDDPAYGLTILAEIADRALSPGVNDSGTATGIVGRLLRLLLHLGTEERGADEPEFQRVFVPELPVAALFDAAFAGIGRDGADKVEVLIPLAHALERLARADRADVRAAAEEQAGRAMAFAEKGLVLEEDLARVRRAMPL